MKITIVQDGVLIPQNSRKPDVLCRFGGVADISYPNSRTRRGRVINNGEICGTICSSNNGLVVMQYE